MIGRKRVPVVEKLDLDIEVFATGGPDGDFGGEDVRGTDGKPIYPGRMVKCPPTHSSKLGVTAPERRGKVRRLYRRATDPKGPVLVETVNGHFFYAEACVRCAHGESEEREHRRLLAIARKEVV
jgi:hypothetical protein